MGCCHSKEETKLSMIFSPKNSRVSKFQSSFNDKETFDKTNSALKSQTIFNELKIKENALRETAVLYDNVLTMNNLKADEEFNFEKDKKMEEIQKYSKNSIQENFGDTSEIKKKRRMVSITSFRGKSISEYYQDGKIPTFCDATNIHYENSIISDNFSLIVDKENIQNIFPASNFTSEPINNKEVFINTFDFTNGIDNSPINDIESLSGPLYGVSTKSAESNRHKRNIYSKSQTKIAYPKPISKFKLDNLKLKGKKSIPIFLKNTSIMEDFTTKFNLKNTKISFKSTIPLNSNNQSKRKQSDSKKEVKFTNKNEELNKMSLKKYSHVFGDVVKPVASNTNLKKCINDVSGDLSNLKSRIEGPNSYDNSPQNSFYLNSNKNKTLHHQFSNNYNLSL